MVSFTDLHDFPEAALHDSHDLFPRPGAVDDSVARQENWHHEFNPLPPGAVETTALTGDLNGRSNQVTGENLQHFGLCARLSCERLLQPADKRVPEGRRDEEAVQRHLEGLGIYLSCSQKAFVGWSIL